MEVKELNKDMICRANNFSFNNSRGNLREQTYKSYTNEILLWDISEEKKKELLEMLYKKNMEILKQEASHLSIMVAGPSNYNAKKLDKGEQILKLSSELYNWFIKIKQQYNEAKNKRAEDECLIQRIYRENSLNLDITEELKKLAILNIKEFIRLYEEFYPSYKWRKNSNIYKMYESAKEGKLQEKNEKIIFEDSNYKVYSKKDRIFIKFVFQPKRQLIFALKKKGYFWNAHECAWSTYLERYENNKEWTETISEQYKNYI